jgi:hypothetical protein
MKTPLKYKIILSLIAILSGIFAGVLAARADLSMIEYYFPLIFVLAVIINFALIALAFKKGRIP